ncbi:MAG: hypothetical protein NTW87_33300 [Planctomycetota bacterium]|nr:hypothetical protein [Planctomycetota bacterium]
MALLGRKSLGLVLGSHCMQVAEISGGSGGCRLLRSAEFLLGEADSLQDPAALGRKLGQFLKEQGFSATQATVGLPAQWLMLKERTLPPATAEMTHSMLLIQAERDFSLEPADLTLDYVPGQATDEGQAVMLVAALRERVEQVRALAEAAGLRLQVITASTLALAAASQRADVLYFGPNGAELVTRGGDGLPRLRHIAPGSVVRNRGSQSAALELAGELRRAVALSQRSGGPSEITVWDDIGIEPALLRELAAEMKMPVTLGERFQAAAVEGLAPTHAAAGAAVALCQFIPALAPVDLLHSRLAVKPPPKLSSRVIWSSVAVVALLAGAAYMIVDWRQSAVEVAGLRQTRDEMKENVEAAKGFIARVTTAHTWYERRPNYLECLRTVTLCFPEEGRAWASSISVREDMRGILTGRAVDEKSVLDVLDRLKSSRALASVKMLHMRGTGTKSAEVSFGMSFVFQGAERP